ncbi:MAG: DUF4834 family protein [Flavobacteriia bacterium]|nr:DUF4834 family protein [Flavobacteriia bacterium]OIP48021.1 MAG: DUF4834 domain-containing protein [Flavobacteriaceae bacterium CG2_30_31_66]PIV96178.1 MAG: DUF4834 domain-containing protein [Flavobacteriaceae bacterium CG17_big_fil_post_rev_8_21_14_2_50_31_13]PIY14394.1 MAG: DUF4834 domain-containing protein [Flavobacteriaceae bacterium CG_4_10_14_3_um_filter_31_253]PIZ10482.1 MAG: DUF4834 domain-containing protein [Flavobacteriaceae bacterium CG_4_10_14_0_8_um_filter_31_99]PJC11088.1 MAG:
MIIGLLKTILIILLFYYGFKFLMRLFAPFLIKKVAEKMQEQAQQQYGNQQQSTVKEGETVIDKAPRNQRQNKDDVGEYVDFEEIDKP